MVSGVGFRSNCRGLLLSFEVSNSNPSSVIGRLTKVYSLRSKLCLDRCTSHEKYRDCCQYYWKNFFAAVSSRPLHPGENWKSFRPDEMEVYQLAASIHKKALEVRVASLLNVIGKKGMDIYETFQWENSSDALKLGKVLEKFEEHSVPVCNETYERYAFFKCKQLSNESLDSYVTALMKLSESCVFGALRE